MKHILYTIVIGLSALLPAVAQNVKVHSHNDYQHKEPVYEALRCGAHSLEADVFLRNGELFVAHSEGDIDKHKTLLSMYILPLTAYFDENKDALAAGNKQGITLFIDIKDRGVATLQELVNVLLPYRSYFDREQNQRAMQVVISGDRGEVAEWTAYPSFIAFDGRLSEVYTTEQLSRVAVYSDTFGKYNSPKDNYILAMEAVNKAHALGKPFRFWGNVDTEEHWQLLHSWGVDYINTDRVKACTDYFGGRKQH